MAADGAMDGMTRLRGLLTEARANGFLGPGAIGDHLDHAEAFAEAVESAWGGAVPGVPHPGDAPARVVDLGSGAGVPALVLTLRWPASRFLLVEANARRASFLERATGELGVAERAEVVAVRAETIGRDPARRGCYDAVVARSFGRPAVTAECAAPLLRVGGILVVSEPPTIDAAALPRWAPSALASLGMGTGVRLGGARHFVAIPQLVACPERFPRRVGVPAKRPLF